MRLARTLKSFIRRRVGLGPFRTADPVSADFGYGRGLPIDRVYIEWFLEEFREVIRGTTLEVGDDSYTARFGGQTTLQREVIHVDQADTLATYHGDMAQPGVLPRDRFDCAVITQTLHLIYDMPRVVRHLRQSLVPGGTLLLTVPGISPIAADRWGETWYWSLTSFSLARLLGDEFGSDNVRVRSYGNAYAATAFLQGFAAADVRSRLLRHHDPRFPVIVAASARRVPTVRHWEDELAKCDIAAGCERASREDLRERIDKAMSPTGLHQRI